MSCSTRTAPRPGRDVDRRRARDQRHARRRAVRCSSTLSVGLPGQRRGDLLGDGRMPHDLEVVAALAASSMLQHAAAPRRWRAAAVRARRRRARLRSCRRGSPPCARDRLRALPGAAARSWAERVEHARHRAELVVAVVGRAAARDRRSRSAARARRSRAGAGPSGAEKIHVRMSAAAMPDDEAERAPSERTAAQLAIDVGQRQRQAHEGQQRHAGVAAPGWRRTSCRCSIVALWRCAAADALPPRLDDLRARSPWFSTVRELVERQVGVADDAAVARR